MSRPSPQGAAAGTVAVLLSACTLLPGSGYPTGIDPEIRTDGTPAPAIVLDSVELPEPLVDRELVDLGWDAVPEESAGVFLGLGQITDDALRLSAVTEEGMVLWTTERPLSCAGFALTADSDRLLAVLTDVSPGRASVAVTTASAYDLHSGEQIWGPVEVPGPHAGPGLVFATLPTGGAMGSSGPRVALDPATGTVSATEDELDGARLVGEYHGTLLIVDHEHLLAHDTNDGRERWRLPLADLDLHDAAQVAAAPDSTPGPGLAFVGDRDTGYALVDLIAGSIVTTAALGAATDPSTNVHVTIDHDQLYGHDMDGDPIWDHAIEPGTRIASAGNGVLYLLTAGNIHTRDTETGQPLGVYEDPRTTNAALPRHIDDAGAAVLETSQGFLLATINPVGTTAAPTGP